MHKQYGWPSPPCHNRLGLLAAIRSPLLELDHLNSSDLTTTAADTVTCDDDSAGQAALLSHSLGAVPSRQRGEPC